jgi:hypothetical protein
MFPHVVKYFTIGKDNFRLFNDRIQNPNNEVMFFINYLNFVLIYGFRKSKRSEYFSFVKKTNHSLRSITKFVLHETV